MIEKELGLPNEYRELLHTSFYDGRFLKRRGDDSYSVSGNGTRRGKILMLYAMLCEDGDDGIDMLREVENMLNAHMWMRQEGLDDERGGIAGWTDGKAVEMRTGDLV